MKTKLYLTVAFGLLFVLGLVALFYSDFRIMFTYLSVVVFGCTFLGGVLHYNSSELVDFREVYREKNRLQTTQIKKLIEQLAERTTKSSCN